MSDSFAVVAVVSAGAALAAGFVNALVGGGTLITFPTLLALGVPPVAANVTNTLALCPGYFGGAMAQRRALDGQGARVTRSALATVGGGLAGAVLLLGTTDAVLRTLVPVLLGLATTLLAFQVRLRRGLERAPAAPAAASPPRDARWLTPALALAAVYGGYFGAGLGVVLLAMLGLGTHESLERTNALKQLLSLGINVTAALCFALSGPVEWSLVAVMAPASLAGGVLGGKLVGRLGRLDPAVLRGVVVGTGALLTVLHAVRLWA